MNTSRIREIPYNYTSFSDREIVLRFLGEEMWTVIEQLRGERRTGRSARMLFEVLGDMWIVERNPFIQDDLIANSSRRNALTDALYHRLEQIRLRAEGNQDALALMECAIKSVDRFSASFVKQQQLRRTCLNKFGRIVRQDCIRFDGLARVSHATDASDWRIELPFVVLTPDHEDEVAPLVKACIEIGLTIVPRGGGTGYTGGAVPLKDNTVIINTEKLDSLSSIQKKKLPGIDHEVAVVRGGAGVITRRISDQASEQQYVFAVDPTSQDASTIGGNVAMNAGGKKAVQYGTTLDNLASWKMVTPQGDWLVTERVNHNLAKIHDQKTVKFRLTRYAQDGKTVMGEPEYIEVAGASLRKTGLGKDVTSKALAGIPGVQKEGCDGLITSAEFILHPKAKHIQTVCLEFFGTHLGDAVPAIVEVKDYLDAHEQVALSGLEHLDERYVRAVNYSSKSTRSEVPKMVLIADISGDDSGVLSEAANRVVEFAVRRGGEGFIAVSPEARRSFWLDRARTAAIAAHTNAFKINEDVVIPLDRLADYSSGIERLNIEKSIENKIRIAQSVDAYLAETLTAEQIYKTEYSEERAQILKSKTDAAREHIGKVQRYWQKILDALDDPVGSCAELANDPALQISENDRVVDLILRHQLRISYRADVEKRLKEIFSGHDLESVRKEFDRIHQEIRNTRLFVATHMHAGDGNVHTNIPVHSNDYQMLHEAERLVDRVMELTRQLDGVISGEHGIGITKYQYMEDADRIAFEKYKQEVDPHGYFNAGKLLAGADLHNAYTPSLRLVQQEAIILEASELGALNDDIRHCLRCGKCKPVCNTHVPRANLLYSPRDKILATGMLIEAFLYEEQTRRGISTQHFDEFNDVADHCTVCHKCFNPCPVNIDFGDVSIRMRNVLADQGQKRVNLGTRLSMMFLNAQDPAAVKWLRKAVVDIGYRVQSSLSNRATKLLGKKVDPPPLTTGKVRQQVVHFLKEPLPSKTLQATIRELLDIENREYVPIIRKPDVQNSDADSVFYFPGCGSERLFSEVGLATLAMLYYQGVQVVLPPGYLCCGYPQTANGDRNRGTQITTENRVLFHRVANTLNYMDIKTVVVSCGTCMDQLLDYEFGQIFPGSQLRDIHEYLFEKQVSFEQRNGRKYLFHDPCHSPMKTYQPTRVVSSLLNADVQLSDRCCGEAGTLAVSRPDISTQIRYRKAEELKKGLQTLTGSSAPASEDNVRLLTACPSCQQGLSRYRNQTGLTAKYAVVELIEQLHGENWQEKWLQEVKNGGIERVLL